ncbi:MAG: PAS domain S-box protein [Deltaproteobacteria bacterium]|nr:PAS domain S-box protein [Deltaproteobacteria bacterium]
MKDPRRTNQELLDENTSLKQEIQERKQFESERNKGEKALRKSEEYFKAIIQNSSDIILVLDKLANITYASPSVERILGYRPDELIGTRVLNLIVPDDKSISITNFSRALLIKESPIPDDFRVKHKDGTNRILEGVGVNLLDNPIVAGFVMNVRDITDRKQTEEKLRVSEKLFRSYLEYAPDGVYMNDLEGNFLYSNSKCEEIIGYRREELIGKSFLELNILSENSLSKAAQLLQANIEGKSTGPDEIDLIDKEGRLIPVEISSSVVQREDQGIVLAFVRDITDRKRAEEALRESEALYHLLAEHMTDIVWMMDLDLNVTWLSPSNTKVRGFALDEIVALPLDRQLTPESLRKAMNWFGKLIPLEKDGLIAEPDGIMSRAMEFYCKGGHTVWLDCTLQFIRDEQGKATGILAEGRDITKRRRAEEELQRTLESLRKAFGATVQVMVAAVESRDPYTAGHQLRVADLARAIATEMGLSKDKIESIRMAGSIHDIGKLSIPAEILSKPTRLSDIEFSLIKEHSQKGYEMLKDVESPWPLAQIVYQHHERMDGSGYPRNLKGNAILMEALIMAVADVVEAMASHRPYRPTVGLHAALEEIEDNAGTLYDADAVDACLRLFREKGFQLAGA